PVRAPFLVLRRKGNLPFPCDGRPGAPWRGALLLSGFAFGPSGNVSVGSKGKTRDKVAAEAEELEAVERERARRRQAEAGKANLPTVSAGNVSTTHEDKGR